MGVAKNYSYGPEGSKLQRTDTPVNGTTTETQYYGTNPHGDVETLYDGNRSDGWRDEGVRGLIETSWSQ